MQVRTYAEGCVPAELAARADALRAQVWAGGGPPDPALRPVAMLLVSPRGEVAAALDVLTKEIEHEGARYRAAGLSAVVTDRARRGRGHGRRLVAAAREWIAADGADLGLFTCDRPLRPFYESAGWEALEGTVLVGGTPGDPLPSDGPGFDKVTMAGFFSARARRAAGSFRGCRIGLYPGEIDRLW
ncbi:MULTISPECIES: GNAT family N-acetyltransferase [Streptomyces]|uniref:GNAT family N-acetyltransferase n=1 Tax=Streptomyces TaxID=1883 RepID=UPI00163BDEFD|nr:MULTISPECIES: GNAT family N-acetyltransferase [Streptomyces]MBC2874950.1 GNAT family N-acetyltransferase [Streptomyces sp. TYQ1024]UBI37391.1 GNAT family N-acetyltransferase [Streptomyces mobaraensis]UKW29981.1 GNAT family N-acetyltransferase [Streptomyces sp. TYQ1024]